MSGNSIAIIDQKTPTITMVGLREQVDTLKQTVAKGATDAQLDMFLTLCSRYQLDPLLREIWFVPQVGIISSRDGYLKVAQRDVDFDGIVSAAVCEGDEFEIEPMIPNVKHKFGPDRGKVIGAYAVVFHKQRRPVVCYASLSEYKKSSSVWTTYTSAMICKVAEVLALKRQFGISGLVTEEEIGVQEEAPRPKVSTPVAKKTTQVDLSKMRAELEAAKDVIGAESFFRILGAEGYETVADIPTRQDGARIYHLFKAEIESQKLGVNQTDVVDAEVVNG
jgi:phage recombination protein Bet